MNKEKIKDIINFFESVSKKYIENYLKDVVSIDKMINDENYAKKMFLFYWAFERKNAPAGFKIASIKSLSLDNVNMIKDYNNFYHGKKNEKRNPMYDSNLKKLNIPEIIKLIKIENFSNAFQKLKLNGIGHKIRSFFIRDIVSLLKLEDKSFNLENYLYMFPIDIWIGATIKNLELSKILNISFSKNITRNTYDLSNDIKEFDFDNVCKLIDFAVKLQISPIKLNMGIWYYCSNYIADMERLEYLLKEGNKNSLEDEMKLIENFGEIKRSFVLPD